MKKQLINEAFRMQQLAGVKPINSLNENTPGYDSLMDAVDDMFKPGTPENQKLTKAVEDALDNGRLEINQYGVEDAYGQVETIAKELGLVKENKPSFYSPDYIIQKYGEEKAKEIEDNIHDEEDNNPNIWDLFTSLETPEEVDHFVQGFIDESYDNPKSKLEAVIQQAWKEDDINKAKNLVANHIKDSKINNDSKKTILNKMKVITDKEKLDYYLANSLLKFEKMGLEEGNVPFPVNVIKPEVQAEKDSIVSVFNKLHSGLELAAQSLESDTELENEFNNLSPRAQDAVVQAIKKFYPMPKNIRVGEF